MFISGLQVTHCFYKYLVKHEITRMRDTLSRSQKYMQIEDAIRSELVALPNERIKGRNRNHSLFP